jgi:hypothetical protein
VSDDDLPVAIRSALAPGERVLWVGRPTETSSHMAAQDILTSAFGWAILGLSAWGFVGLTRETAWPDIFSIDPSQLFTAFSFLLAGLHLVFGRRLVEKHYRKRIVYAVSDKKAYVASSAFFGRLREKSLTPDTRIEYFAGPEATIYFDRLETILMRYQLDRERVWPSHLIDFEFYSIRNGEKVRSLIQLVARAGK